MKAPAAIPSHEALAGSRSAIEFLNQGKPWDFRVLILSLYGE